MKKAVNLYLYGTIGRYGDVDTNEVIKTVEEAVSEGVKLFDVYINSEGGEVAEVISLYNYLDRADIDVTLHVDGVAANMAAVMLCNPRHKVVMSRHALLMFSKVRGLVSGDADHIKQYAEIMDKFEIQLVAIISAKTGKTEEEVKTALFDGRDHWLTSEEALAMKLIDMIQDGDSLKTADVKTATSSKDVENYYRAQLDRLKNSTATAPSDIDSLSYQAAQWEAIRTRGEESKVFDQYPHMARKTFTAYVKTRTAEERRQLWDEADKTGRLPLIKKSASEAFNLLFNARFFKKN